MFVVVAIDTQQLPVAAVGWIVVVVVVAMMDGQFPQLFAAELAAAAAADMREQFQGFLAVRLLPLLHVATRIGDHPGELIRTIGFLFGHGLTPWRLKGERR
ncbi:hypothetical protein DESC_740109 [Desulfosarcina cetonica]|nr:hypothetical protein DESC_740109 [Desulfosarcina cetonica]